MKMFFKKAINTGSVIALMMLIILHSSAYLILPKVCKRDAAIPIFSDEQWPRFKT